MATELSEEKEDRPWQAYHTVYTNAKAGMEGVDKEKVQRVIYEMSKGSKYFENEQKKESFIKQKIQNIQIQRAKLTDQEIQHFQTVAEKKIMELEISRDLGKFWLHVDMDAFYASVEILNDPNLKGKPLAVGSLSMICTASYEARKFGVRAAMPGFIARKLCPDLIFVPTNFEKYTHFSELTRKVFYRYDPDFISASLDEAYLNVTEICSERGISGENVASELRNAIYEETGLTCSVGVAPNRMLAKVCSDINKPNGQFILPNYRRAVTTFISSLPIRKIGGIGKVTESILKEVFGISTCEEILKNSAILCALFSDSSSEFFISVGLGLGGTNTPESRKRKSISSERTFSATSDSTLLLQKLDNIAETLSSEMQKENLWGRNLTLKLKTASFEVRTRAVSLQKYINSKEEILTHATKLLKAEFPLSLRLMGLRISQFRDDENRDPTQKTLSEFLLTGSTVLKAHENEDDLTRKNDDDNDDSAISDLSSNQYADFLLSEEKRMPDLDCKDKITSSSGFQGESSSSEIESKKSEMKWIEDYICSICKIEIPLGFEEERQEHFDFHLAQILQKQEDQTLNSIQLTNKLENSPRKKQKCSSKKGKFITIDAYFEKGKRNM
ncbi:hypothetical protein LUZ60_004968 [Juncus effusus]|nr:hypothetical protein LUZ60_004968 [Juncus effusus]